ncbi:MAG: hypothetical protein V1694_00850 [Candidatus Eisenbacteria bacterium]
MKKCYQAFFAGLVCLVLAAPVLAIEIDPADVLEGTPIPIGGGSPLGCGTTIYENIGTTYFYSSSLTRNVLDDGNFPPGTAPVCMGCVQLAWQQRTQQQLYVAVDFYDTVVPGGPVCNLTWLGGFTVNFGVVAVGGWISNPIDISATPITFPDDSWCVQMRFFRLLSPLTYSTVAHVFFANGGPTVGSNNGTVFWWDANNNGTFDCPSEAYSFAVPNLSQFYLKLSATLTPSATESSSWGTIKALYR